MVLVYMTSVEKIRVLIVDDDPIAIDGLKSILQAHDDLELVGEAVSIAEVSDRIEETMPHLVLMDEDAPGLGTPELIARIKSDWPDVRILLMAVHNEHVGAAMEAGADAFIMKDSDRRHLLRTIREIGRGRAG